MTRSAAAIFAVFFFQAAVLGHWIPRIPDLKSALQISDFTLGLCLLALPAGTLLAFAFAGSVLERIGLRRGCQWTILLWALAFIFPGLSASPQQLFVALLACGLAVGLSEVAMNTKADDIERTEGRRLMSRCHGFWSLGTTAGALSGGALAQMQIGVATHFLSVMPLLAVAGVGAATLLPREQPLSSASSNNEPKRPFRLPPRALLLLCLLPVGALAVEGAFIEWSAVFMRSVFDASPLLIGITYGLFSLPMAATRLCGDWALATFGALRVVRCSAAAALFGISIFALAPGVPLALLGAVLAGCGAAIVYPAAMSAAARRPGAAADNVAAMSLIGFSTFFVLPPAVGLLSDSVGMRWALLAIAPLAALTLVLADEIEVRR